MKNKMVSFLRLGVKVNVVSIRFGCILLLLGFQAMPSQAEEFRYRYVPLNEGPPGFNSFFPAGINDSGEVAGTVSNCDDISCADFHVATYKDGVFTVLQPGLSGPINAGGSIGGAVLLNPDDFSTQSALFHKDRFKLIPPLTGEFFSFIVSLNDTEAALINSFDESFNERWGLYQKGQNSELNFGSNVPHASFISFVGSGRFINNQGVIAGTADNGSFFDQARAFRFDLRTGKAELLEPVPPDTLAWGLAINARGEVLGYSFVLTAPYHERIGIWDINGNFETYIDQTISSSQLLFNDHNLIVITLASGDNSYLVPKPGVRLNLRDLVEDVPAGGTLRFITGINNRGDMIGLGSEGNFMLKRINLGQSRAGE